jgi:aminoglycoside phosphotransferase (APT) family kinase protein
MRSVPDTDVLAAGLSEVISGGTEGVRVTARKLLGHGTFPSEVVTCRLPDGTQRRLFCKYGASSIVHVHGHRGGVGYEAEVYRSLLHPGLVGTPPFRGARTAPDTGQAWLVLDYLDGCVRLHQAADPGEAMRRAADWIGWFHAARELAPGSRPPAGLIVYDTAYYAGWVRRTAEYARPFGDRFPWLPGVCERYTAEVIPFLLREPLTVIHGEYYPKNILLHEGVIYPVDWESTAVAPGEIDLVSMTEGWPAAIVDECERAYRAARWPGGVPAGFGRRLAAARMYWAFRWLGWRPERATAELWEKYLDQARTGATQLGLI